MLTKNDLQQIGSIMDERLEKSLGTIGQRLGTIEHRLDPIEKDLKYLKKKVNKMNKTLNIVAKNYDEGDIKLEKRIKRIERHMDIT